MKTGHGNKFRQKTRHDKPRQDSPKTSRKQGKIKCIGTTK